MKVLETLGQIQHSQSIYVDLLDFLDASAASWTWKLRFEQKE